MATGAADGLFRSLYEGCISGSNIGIEHRPYHRNCRCALHDKSQGNCPHPFPKSKSVSYPIRRAWSEGSLAMAVAASSCHSSPAWGRNPNHRLGPCKEEEEDVPRGTGEV
ncbi:hypothetical protein V6N13_139491 [Hibiscus sabdariffa]|uniref:Uncharacterized protein n=1 Tax=Hibiscus sabdariffa TaxID=183260 RepID=A0ABR2C8A0_9ROSI